jgi:YspA, cpYpsA-related SLOG family
MKILVCGGRDFGQERDMKGQLTAAALLERQFLRDYLNLYYEHHPSLTHVIHGDARGADQQGGVWAKAKGLHEVKVAALWDVHGKAAGSIRNRAMLELLVRGTDVVISFPGGRGTADMVSRALKEGFSVIEAKP